MPTTDNNDTAKKLTATPRRSKKVTGVLYPPKAARHLGIDVAALRRRRAKNRIARKSRAVNRRAAK